MQVRSVQHLLALSESDLCELPIPSRLANLVLVTLFHHDLLRSDRALHRFAAATRNPAGTAEAELAAT
jgi:hypothetical protein